MVKSIVKKIVSSSLLATMMITSLLGSVGNRVSTVDAATPRLMITDYKLSSDKIFAGDTFDLEYTITNTAASDVKNIKATVYTDNNEIVPNGNAGTAYIEKLAAKPKNDTGEKKNETVQSVNLRATDSLEEKTYTVHIKLEYEDAYVPYEVVENIYIPITLKTELKISGVYLADEDIRIGNNFEIVATVSNNGGTTLYNVEAKAGGENMTETSFYIGTIEPGKSKNVDLISKAAALYSKSYTDNKIVVTYENKAGDKFSAEEFIVSGLDEGTLPVLDKDISNLVKVKDDTDSQQKRDMIKTVIIIVVVLAIIILCIVVKSIKKKRLEKEFE